MFNQWSLNPRQSIQLAQSSNESATSGQRGGPWRSYWFKQGIRDNYRLRQGDLVAQEKSITFKPSKHFSTDEELQEFINNGFMESCGHVNSLTVTKQHLQARKVYNISDRQFIKLLVCKLLVSDRPCVKPQGRSDTRSGLFYSATIMCQFMSTITGGVYEQTGRYRREMPVESQNTMVDWPYGAWSSFWASIGQLTYWLSTKPIKTH